MSVACAICNLSIDTSVTPFADCLCCKGIFCLKCYPQHTPEDHERKMIIITNPSWIVNLIKTQKAEKP